MTRDFFRKHERLTVVALLLIGSVLRLYALGTYPSGLNQDEASAGYEAWALLNYGVDRNGYAWPVLFKSWGSGQNVLHSYLSMPIIRLFGLTAFSLRLVSALIGILTLVVFWLMARRIRGRAFGLVALFVLVFNPWHIGISRWALESNLMPFFLLCGVYFTSLELEREFMLIPAAACFGLSLYAYGTAFFFLPPFLIGAVIWLYTRKAIRLQSLIPAFAVFVVIALPITICQAANIIGAGDMTLWGMSLPKLTETRQHSTSALGNSSALENFKTFFGILTTQSDGLPYNALPRSGLYYIFGLPFAVIGYVAALARRRDYREEVPMLLFFAVPFIAAFFIDPNINRMNMAWLPIIYFSALGIHIAMEKIGDFGFVPIVAILLSFAVFCVEYHGEYVQHPSELFYSGLGEAIEYAQDWDGEVYVTNFVNQPYIFVLFHAKIPPRDYLDTATFYNPGAAFEHVLSFGRYRFAHIPYTERTLFIQHVSETGWSESTARFGNYTVIEE